MASADGAVVAQAVPEDEVVRHKEWQGRGGLFAIIECLWVTPVVKGTTATTALGIAAPPVMQKGIGLATATSLSPRTP